MATMMPGDIEEFETEGDKTFCQCQNWPEKNNHPL